MLVGYARVSTDLQPPTDRSTLSMLRGASGCSTRSLRQLLTTVDALKARGIGLRSLHENIDTTATGAAGRQCGSGAFAQKLHLELPEGGEDVEDQPPGRAGQHITLAGERQGGGKLWAVYSGAAHRFLVLLTRPPVTAPDTQDVLDPPIMTLTPDARAMWVGFHDAVESDLRRGGELHPIRSERAANHRAAGV